MQTEGKQRVTYLHNQENDSLLYNTSQDIRPHFQKIKNRGLTLVRPLPAQTKATL